MSIINILSPAWSWQLNWDVIRHDLVIGSCPRRPADLERIRAESRVTAVLSVQHDECLEKLDIDYPGLARHGRTLGMLMERSPMRDFDSADQRRRLPDAVRALRRLIGQGYRVYLHCTAGINRSPLAAVAYLTWVEGQSLEEAMALLQHARPEVSPYWDAYRGCLEDLSAAHADRIRLRAWELSCQEPLRSAEDRWRMAERQVIRDALAG